MTIPDYHSIMYPLLELFSDEKVHRIRDVESEIAKYFGLTEEELNLLLSSGRQGVFKNRLNWANTYLKKACLVKSSEKGTAFITERGLDVIRDDTITELNNRLLRKYPEFEKFSRRKKNNDSISSKSGPNEKVYF
ncbi:winged helix-turn-helix domain-containing protein [Virgibacillus byunsanensis]|uniref:Winged helix-turn-helix domain-containing protein n=1 Tax=Virgibacillus byunsanensis TaxID=570945 RepID=A0ABW3LLT4_9BACI